MEGYSINITVEKLSCIRGDRLLFSNLNFVIQSGQALLVKGANGSGKSSLLKNLAGLLPYQHGLISVKRGKFTAQTVQHLMEHVSYLGHENGLNREQTLYENLIFWAKISKFKGDVLSVIKALNLTACYDLPVRYLSSGQGRRAAFARLLCSTNPVWLLDEPMVGIDEQGVKILEGLMSDHLNRGGLMICTTHSPFYLPPERLTVLEMQDFPPAPDQAEMYHV